MPGPSATPFPPASSAGGPPEARLAAARQWLAAALGAPAGDLAPVSGDASFRRYFRLHHAGRSLILMDAPPEREDSRPFLDVARRLRAAGLHAPEIIAFDLECGFGLLEDLGDTLYRERIDPDSAQQEFPVLFDCLERMALAVDHRGLPDYDATRLRRELDLFTDWYLLRHRQVALAGAERAAWERCCRLLLDAAAEQPQTFVHRDFHSCNLLYRAGAAPGIIDFQDAVTGPISYDFVSLLWDRYISWPRERLEAWMSDMHHRLGLEVAFDQWVRWCDLMGLQRNLKVVGIFARLHYRDGKHGYLEMIPRFYGYLREVLPLNAEFAELLALLEQPRCAP